MLDIRTPLSKDTRVSRKISIGNFVAAPGIWVSIAANGTASNYTTSATPANSKLCISNVSANVYESNDCKVGRITTLESVGCRVAVDSVGFNGSSATAGAGLAVDTTSTHEGQLKIATTGNIIVGVVEGYDTGTGILTYTISSPTIKA